MNECLAAQHVSNNTVCYSSSASQLPLTGFFKFAPVLDKLEEYTIYTIYSRLCVNSVSMNAYYCSYEAAAADGHTSFKPHKGSK